MASLLHLVLALFALGAAESGLETGARAAWGVVVIGLVPHTLAWITHRQYLCGRFKLGALLLRVLDIGGPACFLAALAVCGWRLSLEGWLHAELSLIAWPGIGLALLLAPFLVYELITLDARSRLLEPAGPARAAWMRFQVRAFVAGLAPLALYFVVSALIGTNERLRTNLEEVGLYGGIFAALMLGALAFLLPWLVRHVLDTRPIERGPLRELLDGVARLANFRARELVVWRTGGQIVNAAIVGIGAHSRVVMFSDALLAQMSPREIAAVFAHEMAHAIERHVLLFGGLALAFFLGGDLVARWLFPDSTWPAAAAILIALGVWFLVFGWLSRRCELEADLFAIDLLKDPAAMIAALERAGGHLRDVASWRHFSTGKRVEFLRRAQMDPALVLRLRQTIKRVARSTTLAVVLVLATQGWVHVRALSKEFVQVDLRLGCYASAVRHAAQATDLSATTQALVERARALADGTDVAELERRARSALRAKDLAAGSEWLALGALRGDRALTDLALELDRLCAGDDAPGALDPELAMSWQAELDAASLAASAQRARQH